MAYTKVSKPSPEDLEFTKQLCGSLVMWYTYYNCGTIVRNAGYGIIVDCEIMRYDRSNTQRVFYVYSADFNNDIKSSVQMFGADQIDFIT